MKSSVKKPLAILLAIVLIIGVTACGAKPNGTDSAKRSTVDAEDSATDSATASRNALLAELSKADYYDYTKYAPEQLYTSEQISSVDRYISSEITGKERNVMVNLLMTLSEDDRVNAAYIDSDNNIYATSQSVKDSVILLEKNSDGIYEYPDGTLCFIGSDHDRYSTANLGTRGSSGTGPFQRIISKTGYSAETVYVRLGTNGTDIKELIPTVTQEESAAYVYIGGALPSQVDAGMQHSRTNDNWSLVLRSDGGADAFSYRFKSNQNAYLKFYVPSDGNVTVACYAYDMNNVPQNYSLTRTAAGWKTNGSGCALKRLTTIGQKPENTALGEYHLNAAWTNAMIGQSLTNLQTWGAAQTDTTKIESYPSSSPKVWVTNLTQYSAETDNIDLRK